MLNKIAQHQLQQGVEKFTQVANNKRPFHPEWLLEKRIDRVSALVNSLSLCGYKYKKYTGENNEYPSSAFEGLSKADVAHIRCEHSWITINKDYHLSLLSEDGKSTPLVEKAEGLSIDMALIGFFSRVAKLEYKLNCYKPSVEFFKRLSKLDRDIPLKYLPKSNDVYFLKLPTLLVDDYKGYNNKFSYDGIYFSNFDNVMSFYFVADTYYSIHATRVVHYVATEDDMVVDLRRSLRKVLEKDTDTKDGKGHQRKVSLEKEGIYTNLPVANNKSLEAIIDYLIGVVNTMLYINSQDPEIDLLKPERMYSKKDKKALGDKAIGLNTLPVRLVNWDFHTGRTFNVSETTVSSHMRWQPVGSGLSEVKLIWVKEHIRKYDQ